VSKKGHLVAQARAGVFPRNVTSQKWEDDKQPKPRQQSAGRKAEKRAEDDSAEERSDK
jgi:hypothetical protein